MEGHRLETTSELQRHQRCVTFDILMLPSFSTLYEQRWDDEGVGKGEEERFQYLNMWKMLYFVTVIGVFLQAINGQDWDIEKMEQCPCANDIIEGFEDSVAKNAIDVGNGQKLRLRLWHLNHDDCTADVLDKSPQPGRIEISMVYRGSVELKEQGESEDQYRSDDDDEQQGRVDVGQSQGDIDFGPPQEEDNGQQQEPEDIGLLQGVDIGQLLGGVYIEQLLNIRQEEEELDIGQEQSEVSNDSSIGNGGDKKDYSADFSFTVDVNTGKLSESTGPIARVERRKREIMPFETVIIKIAIKL
ncbi:uncharacterized protein LOC142663091 [Rhinoderma darwinii]|uniref:uncharacterized protein LOC142663091 n=1 Tax=Rhinoderma darwinii TaxID=43563 RepID=UPI003F663E73